MRLVAFVRDVYRHSPGLVWLAGLSLVLVAMLDALALLSVAPVVDLVLETEPGTLTQRISAWVEALGIEPSTAALLGLFLAVNTARAGMQSLSIYVIVRARHRLLRDMMRGTLDDCLGSRWEFFANHDQAGMLNVFVRDFMAIGDAFGSLSRLATGVVQLTMYLAVPFFISWQMTGISVAIGMLLIWPFAALGRISYRLGVDNMEAAKALTGVFLETFSAAKVVLAFSGQKQLLARFDKAFDAHRRSYVRSQTLSRSIPPVYYPLGLTVVVLALVMARRLEVPLSETAVVLYSLLRVFSVIGPLAEEKHAIDGFFASYTTVTRFRATAREHRQPTGDTWFNGLTSEVVLNHVSFTHTGRPPALIDVSARIPKGTFVAFVGESGAGKSTLVDVLIGLHAPTQGEVTVDGVNLRELDVTSYRARIGYVAQDTVLFNTSIRDNIRWAREDASEVEIVAACRLANATEFIDQLPERYDTVVGDRGVRLSGGQVQRLALARAIVRKPDILILDEATSALDSFSERLIQSAIESIARSTTVVAIAHRLSTITKADYIYVMNHGRIVEEGTHAQLVAMNGLFRRIVGLQSLGAHS